MSELIDTSEMTSSQRAVLAVSDLLEATRRASSADDWDSLTGEAHELAEFFEGVREEQYVEDYES